MYTKYSPKPLALIVITMMTMLVLSCEKSSAEEPVKTETTKETKSTPTQTDKKKGTKHDPPIKVDAVAANHWYCDMGTVHYSSADPGDGKCPLCGMNLVQKTTASGDDHDHKHDHKH